MLAITCGHCMCCNRLDSDSRSPTQLTMATNDQEAVSMGPSAVLKGALAAVAIGGGIVAIYYAMKRINKLQENSGLMVELLKKHNAMLSQLTDKLFMEKREPGPLIIIIEKLDEILKIIMYIKSFIRLPWDKST